MGEKIGIILAAGEGKRLKKVWSHPKVLLPLPPNSTLLEEHYKGLKSLNVDRILITTGYKKEEIEKFVNRAGIDVILSEGYLGDTKYGRSLKKTLIKVEEEWGLPKKIVYVMGDHYINYKDLHGFDLRGDLTLAVNVPPYSVDTKTASKVLINNNKITKSGKGLVNFNGLDMGLFIISKKAASTVIDFEDESFDTPMIIDKLHLNGMESFAYPIPGPQWFGCNTPQEVKTGLEKILGRKLSTEEFLHILRRGEDRIKAQL